MNRSIFPFDPAHQLIDVDLCRVIKQVVNVWVDLRDTLIGKEGDVVDDPAALDEVCNHNDYD